MKELHIHKVNPNFILLCIKIINFTVVRDYIQIGCFWRGSGMGTIDYETQGKYNGFQLSVIQLWVILILIFLYFTKLLQQTY